MGDLPDTQKLVSDAIQSVYGVPIEIMVSVGGVCPLVRDLVMLGENAVLILDKRVDDPVDLFVGDRLIARGILEEADGGDEGQLAVRLTEILNIGSGA